MHTLAIPCVHGKDVHATWGVHGLLPLGPAPWCSLVHGDCKSKLLTKQETQKRFWFLKRKKIEENE